MDKYYLQSALLTFNQGKSQWYGFRKTDDNGDTIPNNQRMKYEHLILNDDTATMPTESELNAKIQEIKDAQTNAIAKKASAKTKLKALGLDDAELKTLGL